MAEMQKPRIIFMGTSAFAANILDKIVSSGIFEIEAVYTQPDKKAGRGLKTVFSPVKKTANSRGLPVFQPASLRNREVQKEFSLHKPDFIVVAAYGLILPQEILDMCNIAPINVHGSLLPQYRGAAPIQRAIMDNWEADAKTGISIMKMTAGLDEGPVYAERAVPIAGRDYGTMEQVLSLEGADLLIEVLKNIIRENLQPQPQDDSRATYAHKLEKKDGRIDWNMPAKQVDALVRGVTPWPGAQTLLEFSGEAEPLAVGILPGKISEPCSSALPGQIFRLKNSLSVACADKFYTLDLVRPQGRKLMKATDFANGHCKTGYGLCGRALSFK